METKWFSRLIAISLQSAANYNFRFSFFFLQQNVCNNRTSWTVVTLPIVLTSGPLSTKYSYGRRYCNISQACYSTLYLAFFFMNVLRQDRLCGLVVRVPGYRSEMYCVSCEVRTEFIYVM
jgi:hypothetical protein